MYYRVLSMYYHVLSTFRIIRGNTLYYVCIISVLLYDSSVLCESTVTARNTCIIVYYLCINYVLLAFF